MIVASKLNLLQLAVPTVACLPPYTTFLHLRLLLTPCVIPPRGSRHPAEAPPRENSVNDADLSAHA